MNKHAICGLMLSVGMVGLLPNAAVAQNTSFSAAVHLLVGQSPMVATLPTNAAAAFYDAGVVAQRSYCAEATAADAELNNTQAVLTVYRQDQTTVLGTEGNALEPKGTAASRVCFVAPTFGQPTETVFVKLTQPSVNASRTYTLRLVETTLWANWYFVGSDYSSYTLIRNTTNAPVTVDIRWRDTAGTIVGSLLGQVVPANGVVFKDARTSFTTPCPYPTTCAAAAGSVDVVHAASPEAIVGSQTTLAASTGLSFDTLLFQRRPW